MNKKIFLVGFILLGVTVIYTKSDLFQIFLIKVFMRSLILNHYNQRGQLDGSYTSYVKGNVYLKGSFSNGLKDGLFYKYFDNGQLKNRLRYYRGKEEEIETEFYENGKLNYQVNWENGKKTGNEYHYGTDGKLLNYDAFYRDSLFCFVSYDQNQKFHQILGAIVCPNFYSTKDGLTFSLANGVTTRINNLHFRVAHPPHLLQRFTVTINEKLYYVDNLNDELTIVDNFPIKTVKYNVKVIGILSYPNNRVIKKDTVTFSFTKIQ